MQRRSKLRCMKKFLISKKQYPYWECCLIVIGTKSTKTLFDNYSV